MNGDKVCFWVTGHSMGAGVANLVSAGLVNGICDGNADNVYCYTFAAPNTFYSTDNNENNYREPHGSRYRCIFNIVNEDDFVPEVPMSLCNWTKYGRTAKLSFNSNKSSIESTVRNRDKNLQVYYQWSVTKNFINEIYKGDTKTIEDIVKSFNSIFEKDYDNMRYDAYTFDDDTYVYVSEAPLTEFSMPRNVKPYQIIDRNKDKVAIYEFQMPAYFMQYISFAIKGFWSGAGFLVALFDKRYVPAKDLVIKNKDKIQPAHYLESYYLLTKTIDINSFH